MKFTDNLGKIVKNLPESGMSQHYLLLYSLVYGLEPTLVLEFGAGYSTEVIVRALNDLGKGKAISIDKKPARSHPYDGKGRLTYVEGKFKEVFPTIRKEPIDLFLHDGSHETDMVKEELKMVIPRMKKDGIVLVHDTYRGPGSIQIIDNKILKDLPGNLEYVTLPYGYGLSILRVTHDFGNGSIKTTWKKANS